MKKTAIDIKSAIVLLLALVLILGLAACGATGSTDIGNADAPAIADTGDPIEIPAPDANAHAFTDVPGWCADAADWAAGEGIASGVGNNRFAPNDPCTIEQIITMLWRDAGQPKGSKTFPGTTSGYARTAMNWAYSQGMIGATAKPGMTCDRIAAAQLI